MDANNKEKMLKLMRFWLFGTFVIVFTASTLYVGYALQTGLLIFRELNYWLAIIITAALSVGWYFLYKWYLDRQ